VSRRGQASRSWWARSAVPGPQSPEEWAAWGSGLNAGVAEAIAAARQREGGVQARLTNRWVVARNKFACSMPTEKAMLSDCSSAGTASKAVLALLLPRSSK